MCSPFVCFLATTTGENANNNTFTLLSTLFLEQIGIGVLIGASFSVISNQLRQFCMTRDWVAKDWQPLLPIALAVGCFATAQHLGGSGFIACFVGGLIFGGIVQKDHKEELLIAAEATGDTLSLITWVAFGSSVVVLVFRHPTWQGFLYGVLSLTVIRMLPVFLAVFGLKLDQWTTLFVGWFGPRGLASIVFAVTVLLLIYCNLTPITVKAQSPQPTSTTPEITANDESSKSPKLRVGVAGEPPGVIIPEKNLDTDMTVTGIAVETWDILAKALGLQYELVYDHNVLEVLEKLANKEIDIAIGGITTTDKNITRFDFTQPVYQDSLAILVPSKSPTLWSVIRPFLRWAFLSSIIVIFLCLFTVGNLLWLAERHHNSEQFPKSYFKGVTEGMWCALTTFSTVGYGDRYPITHLGRLIAGSWMIISVAVITTLTAGVATTIAVAFSAQPYQKLQKPSDVKGIRLATISGSTAVQWGQYYQARMVGVEHISGGISLLESNQVDGVLYTRLVLEHYLQENPKAPYQLVGFNIGSQYYSIALTPNDPLTQKLNEKLLSIKMQLRFQEIQENWFKLQPNN